MFTVFQIQGAQSCLEAQPPPQARPIRRFGLSAFAIALLTVIIASTPLTAATYVFGEDGGSQNLEELQEFYARVLNEAESEQREYDALRLGAHLLGLRGEFETGIEMLEGWQGDFENVIDSLENEFLILNIEMLSLGRGNLDGESFDNDYLAIKRQIREVDNLILHYIEESGNSNASQPSQFTLYPAFPNPFNSQTRIGYYLPESGDVEIALFDSKGRMVKQLPVGEQAAGKHQFTIDASDIPSGSYTLRLDFDGQFAAQNISLIR